MSQSDFEQYDVDELGRRSFYVHLKMGAPVVAEDEDAAVEKFIRLYFRQHSLNAIHDPNGYSSFETHVTAGPQRWRRKKDAPVVCDKCKQDIKPEEFPLHASGECKDRLAAAVQTLIDSGAFG